MKLYVTIEEFLYAKRIENQTQRMLRGYQKINFATAMYHNIR